MSTTTASGTQPNRLSFRMSPRDLITVGMFAALYLVIVYAINMLGFINPTVMLAALAASIVAGGIPFLLFLTRVRHAGMVTLFAVLIGGLFVLTGHPPISLAVTVAVALAAEVIVWAGRYRSRRLGVLAYAVFALWYVGPMLPLFYAREDYFASASMRQMGEAYIEQMDALFSPGMLIGFGVSTVLFGVLGGLLGLRLLRKHFEKAGLA